jgi:NADH:ubiquinone oxidoreductase subunit 3 (subunit A)
MVLIESAAAFVLILAAACLIYVLGRRAAPKPAQTEGECSTYACGEKVAYPKLRVNVSLYKYLIYFVVLDSSVLLLAFGSFLGQGINVPFLLLYLGVVLACSLLLFEGGKDTD